MTTETIKADEPGELGRAAFVRADTLNEDERTVEVTWTTGAAVPRYYAGIGRAMEELEVSKSAIRLDRLNNGAPLLNSHMDWSLRNVIGVVERAWVEGNEGRALVRFSAREDVTDIFNDVRDGVIRNISVGYRVHRYEVIDGEGDKPTRVIARDWEPLEISAVPIGADDQAGFRSAASGENPTPCEFVRAEPDSQQETEMTKEAITAPAPAPALATDPSVRTETPAPAIDQDALRKEGVAAEQKRQSDIRSIARKLKIGDDIVDPLIDAGNTVEEARAAFIDHMAAADDKAGETNARFGGQDETDTRRSLIINAVEHRMNPSVELQPGANEYRGTSMLEIAKDVLAARGVNVRGLSRSEIAAKALRGSHQTSDFPFIMANVARNRLQAAYQAAPQTFRPFVNETTLPDFKTTSVVALSDAPSFVKKLEGAEYQHGTVGEAREQYALATYGRVLAFTREMLINDDLRAFDRMLTMYGTAAANLESDIVWSILLDNSAMADGTALFHADHGNLLAAAGISVASLGVSKAAMRKQRALAAGDGETGSYLNLRPKFLAVPPDLETVAQQYTRQTSVVTDPDKQNVHAGTLEAIVEPRLGDTDLGGSADDWYIIADPNQVDTIDFAYLEGERGVQIFEEDEFSTDSVAIKARLDVAAKAIDYRGFNKNPGS